MLLSIAIPSHNKTHLLKEALESIIKEPEFGLDVDVVISDNSLNDQTRKLFEKEYNRDKNINWFNSKKYKCLDSNINRAVELASGEYVWIFGDDDFIEKGILLSLTEYLKNENPEILIVNSKSFKNSNIVEETRVPIDKKKIYGEKENDLFLREMGGYLTYVGSIIVKKEHWVKSYDFSKIGTYFAHVACIANIKNGNSAHFFPSPAINMRIGEQTWTNKAFLIWHKFYPELIWSLKNYSKEAKNSVISQYPIESLKVLAASRAYKRFNFKIWKEIILKLKINLLLKFASFFISIIPSKILANLYILFIKIYRKNHTFSFSPKLAITKLKM